MKKSILFTLAALIFSVFNSQASDYKAGKRVVVNETQDENIYIAGKEIVVNAVVNGDLIVAGGEVQINNDIRDDATIVGGEIQVMGVAGSDLRVFGGEILITKDVHGDLVITGGEVEIAEGVTIWGDLVVAGGEVESYGLVKGSVKAAGGEIDLGGVIEGELDLVGGEVELYATVNGASAISAQMLHLGRNAQFFSDVRYWSKDGHSDFEDHMMNDAQARFDSSLKKEFNFEFNMKKAIWSFAIFRILSGIALISLLVAVFGRFFAKNAGGVRDQMGSYLGAGLLMYFGLPLASAIAFGTVIGIPLGVVGMSLFIIVLVVANALTAVVAAYELREHRKENWNTGAMIGISIGLFVALRILSMIPVGGGLVNFALSAVAIGYVVKNIRKKRNNTEVHSSEEIV